MSKSSKGIGKFNMTKVGFAFIWLIKSTWFYPTFTLYLCILAVFLLAPKHLQHQTSWIEAEKGRLPWWHTLLGWRTPLAHLILCMFLESGTALEISLFWGIYHLLLNQILPGEHQFSDHFAHIGHSTEHCWGKDRGGFPCGGAAKK